MVRLLIKGYRSEGAFSSVGSQRTAQASEYSHLDKVPPFQLDKPYIFGPLKDVSWSSYVGRKFAASLPDDDFPLPYIDAFLDEMHVAYVNLAHNPITPLRRSMPSYL